MVIYYVLFTLNKDTYSLRFLLPRHPMPKPYAEKKIEIQSVLHFLETNEKHLCLNNLIIKLFII